MFAFSFGQVPNHPCICDQTYDRMMTYICCETCTRWFHTRCFGLIDVETDQMDKWYCNGCMAKDDEQRKTVRILTRPMTRQRMLKCLQILKHMINKMVCIWVWRGSNVALRASFRLNLS